MSLKKATQKEPKVLKLTEKMRESAPVQVTTEKIFESQSEPRRTRSRVHIHVKEKTKSSYTHMMMSS